MLATLDLEEAARKAAGNWQQFKCFVWFRAKELQDADQWAVIYTHNRDSGLLDQSNAAFIAKALQPFAEAPHGAFVGVKGQYYGNPFVLRIYLEPLPDTEIREVRDVLRNEVRAIKEEDDQLPF